MSQAIQVYEKIQDPFESAILIGEHFAKSGMFGVDRREAGTILALACITENRTPFEIARTYDIVDGKLRKKALACFAEFREKGAKVRWINTGDDGREAEAEIVFEGQTLKVKFNIEDAKRQGLVRDKSNWIKTPGNMLRARVITNAIGMLCPEIVAGMTDSDDEGPTPEPKELLKTAKPAKAEPKIVEAEVVPPTEPPQPPTPPTQTTAAAAAPEPQKFVAAVQQNGKLTLETVNALGNAIPAEHQAAAMKWMEEKKWIIPMGSLEDLSQVRAQKILDRPAAFVEAVNGKGGK